MLLLRSVSLELVLSTGRVQREVVVLLIAPGPHCATSLESADVYHINTNYTYLSDPFVLINLKLFSQLLH